jgi:GxxExxY protein
MTENEIGTKVLEAAIGLHRDLGPGLLEIVYEVTLARELSDLGLAAERQVPVAIHHKAITFEEGFRADLLVEAKVPLELKSGSVCCPLIKVTETPYLQTRLADAGWTKEDCENSHVLFMEQGSYIEQLFLLTN